MLHVHVLVGHLSVLVVAVLLEFLLYIYMFSPFYYILMSVSVVSVWSEMQTCIIMAQLMPLPLTVSCFSKIQIGFTFLLPAHIGSPVQRAVKRVCVCAYVCVSAIISEQVSD